MNSRSGEYDEDEDSLFGSPPSSPLPTGRQLSPTLALPSANASGDVSRSSASVLSATVNTQNVGTIALPGSHLNSELPINPLALSLNHGVVHRPPALPQMRAAVSQPPADVTATASTISLSSQFNMKVHGASTSTPTTTLKNKATKSVGKSKKRSRTSSSSHSDNEPSIPRDLEFTLPDPSAPPPTHFLRNQENLLGRAGRVGGVKPATITHMRGATPSNPILIDDEDSPMIGRQHRSIARESSQPYIDPSKLTPPTNQEIVSVLVLQKDIFPVLESILKLIVKDTQVHATPRPTGFERRQTLQQTRGSDRGTSQPPKKRKLNRVPAGATDWDVPYPFPEGEGPTAYEQTWERERGKQLVAELIKLIKVAARKAATKKFLLEQERERNSKEWHIDANRRVNGYYRPETAMYGLEKGRAEVESDVLKDTSNASHSGKGPLLGTNQTCGQPGPSSNVALTPNDTTQSTFSFDYFSVQDTESSQLQDASAPVPDLKAQIPASSSYQPANIVQPAPIVVPEGADQNMFDTWMSFLEAFPVSFGDSANPGSSFSGETTPATTTPSLSLRSTPGVEDHGMLALENASKSSNPSNLETVINMMLTHPVPSPAPDIGSPSSAISSQLFDFTPTTLETPPSISDYLIDPKLLSISNVDGSSPSTVDINSIMDPSMGMNAMHAESPVASTSSLGGSTDPTTPASANWDQSLPDVFVGREEGMWRNSMWSGFDGVTYGGLDGGSLPMELDEAMGSFGFLPEVISTLDKGKGRAVEQVSILTPRNLPPSATVAHTAFQVLLDRTTGDKAINQPTNTTLASGAAKYKRTHASAKVDSEPSAHQLRKEDIIKRAKERRQQIQEELDMVKQQLWETTIEQAALIHLTRKLDDGSDINS